MTKRASQKTSTKRKSTKVQADRLRQPRSHNTRELLGLLSHMDAMLRDATIRVARGDAREAGKLMRALDRAKDHSLMDKFLGTYRWLLQAREDMRSYARLRMGVAV